RVETDDQLRDALKAATPGTKIVISPGNYSPISFSLNGERNAPILLEGENDGVTFDRGQDGINVEGSSFLVLSGLSANGNDRAGLRIVNSNHIKVSNCRFSENGKWGIFTGFVEHLSLVGNHCNQSKTQHGIYVSNSGDHVTIRENRCAGNSGSGIQINGDLNMGGDGIISDCKIIGNALTHNGTRGGAALNFDGLQNSIISNNCLEGNHASGLALYRVDAAEGAMNNLVLENRIIQPEDGRWCVTINNGSSGNILHRNTFYNNHPTRGSVTIDASSSENFKSFKNSTGLWFSVDGGESRIEIDKWQRLGFGLKNTLLFSEPNAQPSGDNN
ncbi:MAG: right-handed parallel beta-helix repeat-containing protein, partial [Opitutales bacterium]|nr:right-handed parallel beta-helix repeat-containing protein [Opitutales bacterium]